MKIIAFYLPQFHEIPENDEWWGQGFTEWINVRKAKPLFVGHEQPRVPLDGNYYNLLDDSVKIWQAELAKKYGVYGFCYYHYWFNGKLLLQKPMEQMLKNKSIDIPFCICWANESWTKAWIGENEVLIPQKYGNEAEWDEHFYYLLPFMRDRRYIKQDGKPLLVVYRPEVIECLDEMLERWQTLAKKEGLEGLALAYQQVTADITVGFDDSKFSMDIEFQPAYANIFGSRNRPSYKNSTFWRILRKAKRIFFSFYEKRTGNDLDRTIRNRYENIKINSFDDSWKDILEMNPVSTKSVPGAHVGWDNTPRKGMRGLVEIGSSPEKFEEYMTKLIKKAKEQYKTEFIFITAWNEWAEGCVLEPDQSNGHGYLEGLRNALIRNDEFPNYNKDWYSDDNIQ